MSSVLSSFAQPVTRKLVTIYNQLSGNVDFFLQSDFDTWYQANRQYITKVTESMYIVNGDSPYSVSQLLRGVDGAPNVLEYDSTIDFNITLEDMSKEIRVGSLKNSESVVFRKVKTPGNGLPDGPLSQTGYVVIENNERDLTRPRFKVSVARV